MLALALALAGLTSALTTVVTAPSATADPTSYAASGPYEVAVGRVEAPGGQRYDVFRPASYAAVPFRSPIITWGNGTKATPDDYRTLLGHLASWGFTVIASTQPDTGSGREILEGARLLVRADRRPDSPFVGHLDTGEIAAVGHSQGATGAVRAAVSGGRLISTVVTFSLPWNGEGPLGSKWATAGSLGWSAPNPDCRTARDCWPDPAALRQPTFLVSTRGPIDAIVANPAVERCYFEAVRAPAALGIVTWSDGVRADHSSIQDRARGGDPGGFLGYVTAWLLDQLRHDRRAASSFSGSHPALLHDSDWSGSAVKQRWTGDGRCATIAQSRPSIRSSSGTQAGELRSAKARKPSTVSAPARLSSIDIRS